VLIIIMMIKVINVIIIIMNMDHREQILPFVQGIGSRTSKMNVSIGLLGCAFHDGDS